MTDRIGERPSRKKVDREARRQRILDAAFLLIEEKGVHGMSLHQLAKKLGYTVGALYRYFSSRDALIAELQGDALKKLTMALERVLESGQAFAEEEGMESVLRPLFLLRLLVDFYEVYAEEAPAHFRLTSLVLAESENILSGEDALRVFEIIRETLTVPASLVAEGVEQGVFVVESIPEQLMLFWSSLHGVMQARKLARFAPGVLERERLVPQGSRLLLRGWGATDEQLDAADRALVKFQQIHSLQALAQGESED